MSAVNEYPDHVVEQMGKALNVIKAHMEAQVPAGHHLRGSHLRLLNLTPMSGIRPTDLATRMGMTKQSLGEFVAAMDKAGYLKVDVDPSDRRARIVSPTAKGIKLQRRIQDIITASEDRWEAEFGARQWATFRKVLGRISAEGRRP